jgi:hypothetical protein
MAARSILASWTTAAAVAATVPPNDAGFSGSGMNDSVAGSASLGLEDQVIACLVN